MLPIKTAAGFEKNFQSPIGALGTEPAMVRETQKVLVPFHKSQGCN